MSILDAVTVDDLREWVAAMDADNVVGYRASASRCLLATYAQERFGVRVSVSANFADIGSYVKMGDDCAMPVGNRVPLSAPLSALASAFDDLDLEGSSEAITAAQAMRLFIGATP